MDALQIFDIDIFRRQVHYLAGLWVYLPFLGHCIFKSLETIELECSGKVVECLYLLTFVHDWFLVVG